MYELRYHKPTRRWRIYEGKLFLYPLHCGDPVMLELGGGYYPTNVELDTEWYVALGGMKFWLHTQMTYQVLRLN